MRILTDLMEAAASTLSPQRQHELLARRQKHHEDSPSYTGGYVLTHGHHRINNGNQTPFDIVPDILSLSPADQAEIINNSSLGTVRSKLLNDVIQNPQNYLTKPIGTYNNYIRVPPHLSGTKLGGLAIGIKTAMAARGLDAEDFYDYAAHIKHTNRHSERATTFKGKVSRAKAKANEDIKKQAAAGMAGVSSFKPSGPPPTIVDISPRNRGISNPYYKGANQWRGDPAQTPWQKNGNKKCYDTIRLALHELGYDLVDMQHSDITQWKDDYYYSTTSDGKTVRIYHDPTMASGFLISFGGYKAYRVKRIYNASDYNATKAALKVHVDDAKQAGRII